MYTSVSCWRRPKCQARVLLLLAALGATAGSTVVSGSAWLQTAQTGVAAMQAGRKPAANTATAAVPKPLRVAPGSSSGYAVGTIVESRSYEVRANIKGRAQSIFLQEGQYVRKGDILVKGWDYTFAVATTDAIVLKQLMAPGDYLQPSSPVALLAAVQPFRIALPIENTPRKVGDIVRLQGGPQGGQVATGVVVGSAVEGGRCILELRLRSLEHGLMLVGTSVRVETVTARQ